MSAVRAARVGRWISAQEGNRASRPQARESAAGPEPQHHHHRLRVCQRFRSHRRTGRARGPARRPVRRRAAGERRCPHRPQAGWKQSAEHHRAWSDPATGRPDGHQLRQSLLCGAGARRQRRSVHGSQGGRVVMWRHSGTGFSRGVGLVLFCFVFVSCADLVRSIRSSMRCWLATSPSTTIPRTPRATTSICSTNT